MEGNVDASGIENGVEVMPQDVRQTEAWITVEKALQDFLISQSQYDRYTKKLLRLHEGILKTNRSEKGLSEQSNNLREELLKHKEHLRSTNSRSFEDTMTIAAAKKDLAKWKADLAVNMEREERERVEISTLEKRKMELEDLVELERQKKADELEPQIHALTLGQRDLEDEIAHQKGVIERLEWEKLEIVGKISKADEEKTELEVTTGQLRQAYSHIRSDPEKYRKQADVVQTALKSLRTEWDRLSLQSSELETELNNIARARKDALDIVMTYTVQLDKHRSNIEGKERQGAQHLKDSEREKLVFQNEIETRGLLESRLKKLNFKIRRKNEEFLGKERELNAAIKSVKKAKASLENGKKSIPELQNTIDEMKGMLEKEIQLNKKYKVQMEELRADRDSLLTNFTRLGDIEKTKADQVKVFQKENEELELDLDRLILQEHSIHRSEKDITIERDARRNECSRNIQSLRKVMDQLRLKDIQIIDLERIYQYTNVQLDQFEGMYEIVKSERNKYSNQLQATQLLGSELTEKIKIISNEIDIRKNECDIKERTLFAELSAIDQDCSDRDAERGDINKLTYLIQLKEGLVDQGNTEIRKLNTIIKTMENDMVLVRKQYESMLTLRNTTGIQLVNRNAELCELYERYNTMENTLHNADIELNKREEEKRILNLKSLELQREIQVSRKSESLLPKLEEERRELYQLLQEKKKEVRKLSRELESPENTIRWRSLEGEDPSPEDLVLKIKALDSKIAVHQAKILEKDLILTEAKELMSRLLAQINAQKESSLKLAQKVNEYKSQMGKVDKKTMAIVAQISLNQMTQNQLLQEKSHKEETLKMGDARFKAGLAPSEEMEHSWMVMNEREMERIREEKILMEQQALLTEMTLSDGTITTADKRATMYIPVGDPLGIPKPYGANPPMKPHDPSQVRFVRNPKPKELFI